MTAKDSGFRDWQQTCKVIDLEEFAEKFPETYEEWELEQSPPENIFLYRGDYWIFETEPNTFLVLIEKNEYVDNCLEIIEMTLFLWLHDENCQP